MINDLEQGGLKVPDVESFSKALKLIWIKKLLDPLNSSAWKCMLVDDLEHFGGDKILCLPITGFFKDKNVSGFWKEIFNIWASVQLFHTTTPESLLAQPIFLNKCIKIDNSTIFKPSWIVHDVIYVNDLVNARGKIKSFADFIADFNVNCSLLEYNSVISAIPRQWRKQINEYGEKLFEVRSKDLKFIKSQRKITQYFYKKIIKSKIDEPKGTHDKWERDLECIMDPETWEQYHYLPYLETCESKIQTLQFRITNRIFFTNTMLMKRKLLEHEQCSFCLAQRETLLHLFMDVIGSSAYGHV